VRADSVVNTIVLIGDAGQFVRGKAPVMRAARRIVPFDEKTTVIYLGDNIYRHGLPDDRSSDYAHYRDVIDSQALIAEGTPSKVYFIPGNHDWVNGQASGLDAVRRQQQYVDALRPKQVHFEPKDGCPGPVEVSISKDIVLVMMDSQWWIHRYEKPGIESDCDTRTEAEVIEQIQEIAAANDKKLLIFACHHPFRSAGYHGGYYSPLQYFFPLRDLSKNLWIPLPGLGAIYPITRGVFGTPQDLKHPGYANMIRRVEEAVRKHPHPVFVHGHEHTLQYFHDTQAHFVVSGSGCKENRIEPNKRSTFVSGNLGFAVMDVYANKTVQLTFYEVKDDDASVDTVYSSRILDFSKLPAVAGDAASTNIAALYQDSVGVAAGPQYTTDKRLRRFMVGDNYRQEWATPLTLPVFHLNKVKGGMRVVDRGGGMQTLSLRLVDKTGREWTLRTIDKNPESVVPEGMRATFARDVVQDMISASHPYGALVVPPLADAAGVLHANPEVYFVPNDPAFGYYRALLANKVCLLEEREPVPQNVDTRSTEKVFNQLIDKSDHLVDQPEVLRARLLDILIGDWDRHFGQWRFAVADTGRGKLYEAIPRDRDQAFFRSDGFIMKVAARNQLQHMKGFGPEITNINRLGFNARYFDRVFLTDLDEGEWRAVLEDFTARITDSVIDAAVRRLPERIYEVNGPKMAADLKSRRDQMVPEGLEFYRFLSQDVNVLGTNNAETFRVSATPDNGIRIRVWDRNKEGDTTLKRYDRTFKRRSSSRGRFLGIPNPVRKEETEEVRLFGFNGDDKFIVDEDARSTVDLRVVGGTGNDTFDIRGRVKTHLYDLKQEDNQLLASRRVDNRMETSYSVNDYELNEYRYSRFQFPTLTAGFNPDDGIMAGLGLTRQKHGFRHQPYRSLNRLTTLYSFTRTAFRVNYYGEFVDLIKRNDLLVQGSLHRPTVTNFFGLGNETARDLSIPRRFYRVNYSFATADVLLLRRLFGNTVRFGIGPSVYHYWYRDRYNEGRIFDEGNFRSVGLDSLEVYADKTYAGGKAIFTVNNLNSNLFPTRGIAWHNELVAYRGIDDGANSLTRFASDMQIYASLSDVDRLVGVLRLGGGHIFSKDFEYFQALGLGQNSYLRGFRKNRFAGNSMLYASVEARYRLADIKSYILPGQFGLVGFQDVGRVWMRDEESKRWHATPGVGVYYIPFNLVIISATTAFSSEEVLFNVTVGTRLNLTL